jgi:hypothetical protein
MSACSNQENTFDGMVPAGATSVSYAQHSDAENGVAFHVTTQPKSYKDIDVVRARLRASGYTLCEKSAISEWAPQPEGSQHQAIKGFWIVELYASDRYKSFFSLRAESIPTAGGTAWNQGFSLASQTIPEGRQDMVSIKEFCD